MLRPIHRRQVEERQPNEKKKKVKRKDRAKPLFNTIHQPSSLKEVPPFFKAVGADVKAAGRRKVAVLGMHCCGALSVKAIELYVAIVLLFRRPVSRSPKTSLPANETPCNPLFVRPLCACIASVLLGCSLAYHCHHQSHLNAKGFLQNICRTWWWEFA